MASPAQTLQALQLFQQGQQLVARGDNNTARQLFARACAVIPEHPDLLAAYATCAEQAQDWATAEKILRRLALLRPQLPLHTRLAQSLYHLDRLDEAITLLGEWLSKNSRDTDALRMLGLMLTKQCRWEDALNAGQKLNELAPGATACDIVLNALFHLGRGTELDALVEDAMTRYPDDLLVMSVCVQHLVKRGDYARGFAYPHAVRMRFRQGIRSVHQAPPNWWDGKPFKGVLLVTGKQGIGDEIIAANMFTDLQQLRRSTGQEILVECDPRLLPLFRRSFPELEFAGSRGDDSLPDAVAGRDYRSIKALDLACHFRRQTPLAPQRPWLVADPARVDALRATYRQQFPHTVLAGISWKSSRAPQGANKSMTMTDLAPLLSLPAHTWFNLQYGDIGADLAEARAAGLPPLVLCDDINPTQDIDALVAQIAALDVVVSTSNTTAHLAGAVGARCHLMLPKSQAIFWYWRYEGEQTPWYPSITIHRNRHENDWRELAASVAAQTGQST
jgi:tetratricopeptide (TPR) repeat protein